MWYTTKVGPDVANTARQLEVHMSHLRPEHWKALGCLIGYIIVKDTKFIVIRNHKFLKQVIFFDYNYAKEKETIDSVISMVTILGGIIPTCPSKTQRTVMLICTEEEYVALSEFAEQVKFVSMLLEEMNEVQKPSFIYENYQRDIFLAKNRQFGMRTKHIDIHHHFLKRQGGR